MTNWLIAQQGPLLLALLAALLINRYLTKYIGAKLAYSAWSIVPLMLIINNLPSTLLTVPNNALQKFVVSASQSIEQTSYHFDTSWIIWVVGCALVLIISTIEHYVLAKRLAGNNTLHSSQHAYSISYSDTVASPILLGFFAPKLVLPSDFERKFSLQQQALILAHETVHAKRYDNLTNLFALFLLALFWFNPLSWIAYGAFRKSQEIACDHAVLASASKAEKVVYCQAMLMVAANHNSSLNSYSYYTEKTTMEQRLNYIKAIPRGHALLKVITSLAVVSILTSVAFANGGQEQNGATKETSSPIVRVEPKYPPQAAQQHIEGSVVLGFTITSEGTTDNITIIAEEPKGVFGKNAVTALKKWRYKPVQNEQEQFLVQLDFALSEDYKPKHLVEKIVVQSHNDKSH